MEMIAIFIRYIFQFSAFVIMATAITVADDDDRKPARPVVRDERPFLTDFRTLCEGIVRVARDRGLSAEIIPGTGVGWEDAGFKMRAREAFALKADPQSLPFLGDQAMRPLAHIGPVREHKKGVDFRAIILDLETGELRGPAGVDLAGLRIHEVEIHVGLTKGDDTEELYDICIRKSFEKKQLTVSISSELKGGRELSRDLLNSLESRVKLASKLREIRKQREGKQKGGNKEGE
jgi:hypothetical protein